MNKKRKILVFGLSDNIGGIETFYLNYFRNIERNKYDIDFITCSKNKMAFEDELVEDNCKVYHIPNFNRNLIGYIKAIKKIIKNNKYNCVHINMLSAANIIPLKISKKMNIEKIIVHSHNTNIPSSKLKKILHKMNKNKIKKYANYFLACSKLAGEWMYGEDTKFVVLNNAIDYDKYAYSEESSKIIKKENNIAKEFVIGHVGKYCEQKNQLFLIDVIKKITEKKHNFKVFLIGGTGEDKLKIINKIDEYKLNNYIILKENVKDIWKYYNAFDIFVLPSLFEGLPVVGVEAQANGLPCVFSDKITTDLKINNNIEFIQLDINKWAETIIQHMEIRKDRENSKENIEKNGYSIKCQAKELEKIYD